MADKGNVKKICSFCVSDWHFITMLIPYIHTKLEKNEKIEVFTQHSQFDAMSIFLSKLTLNDQIKQKLIELNWNTSKIGRYSDLQNRLEKIQESNITIIVKGENSYIEKLNRYIEKWNINEKKEYKQITILNCYEVMQFNKNIESILAKHDKILNTSGEKEIEEVFEGFSKKVM